MIMEKIHKGLYNKIHTYQIDDLAAETCAYLNIIHPDYSLLAARIAVNNLHKQTEK